MTQVSIRSSGETSKQLHGGLARAYQAGDLSLVKRVSALLAIGRGEKARGRQRRPRLYSTISVPFMPASLC